MFGRRLVARGFLGLALCVALAGTAGAQNQGSGSIAGVVKDASGAVLPGVTVEAASPALIQGVQAVATDSVGQYKIVDLRPGLYTITFSLGGFGSVKREGIELTTGFTATVNIEMSLGTLQETVTVSSASPVVDVQNVLQKTTLSGETRNELPLPSNSGAYVTIIPGATGTATNQDVGGAKSESAQAFTIHGSNSNDYQQLRDGMFYGTMLAAGNYMSAVNTTAVQEVNVLTGGGVSAESESGGAQVNVISRDGGNLTKGSMLANFGSHDLQSNNITPDLVARGAAAPTTIKTLYEIAAGVGGPIRRNKLWYFVDARRWISSNNQAGQYYNATQGTLFYTPDLSRPAYDLGTFSGGTGRLTWQATDKDRITGMFALEKNCDCFLNISNGQRAPEATTDAAYWPNYRSQVTWRHPTSNRLLLEAGMTIVKGQQHGDQLVAGVQGQTFNDISVLDSSRNFRYGAPGQGLATQQAWGSYTFGQTNGHVDMSYVTGSHAFKTGLQMRYAPREQYYFIPNNFSYTFNGRTPQSIQYFAGPLPTEIRQSSYGIYAQDQWTLKRLTLNGGLRLDALHGWIPAQHLPGGPYGIGIPFSGSLPPTDFPEIPDGVNWKDLSPRMGGAYDIFGNGKTAVKASLARYVTFTSNASIVSNINPLTSMVSTASRNWTDSNGDYIPQASELGPLSNAAFGTVVLTTNYADDITHGFGVRPSSWQGSVSVQQELRPGVALLVGYFRTWYNNFTVTDNLAVTPADFNSYSFTAPVDPRLPNSGQLITGLADVTPAKFGLVNNLVDAASKYGKQTDIYNGVDVTIQARLGRGRMVQGGLSTGSEVTDRCFVVDSPQELYQCHISPPWSAGTQVKFSVIYPLPWQFQASAVYQNLPPIPTTASYVVPNALIAPSLGRNLGSCRGAATCNGTATVSLIPPTTLFDGPRDQQVDLRLTRVFQAGAFRMEPQLTLSNLFNNNAVLTQNQTYGPSWQNVTALLGPRVIKLGVLINF